MNSFYQNIKRKYSMTIYERNNETNISNETTKRNTISIFR